MLGKLNQHIRWNSLLYSHNIMGQINNRSIFKYTLRHSVFMRIQYSNNIMCIIDRIIPIRY